MGKTQEAGHENDREDRREHEQGAKRATQAMGDPGETAGQKRVWGQSMARAPERGHRRARCNSPPPPRIWSSACTRDALGTSDPTQEG